MDETKLLYRETHEWVSLDGEIVTVGLSKFALCALTDLTNIVLPEVGAACAAGECVGEVETVKAGSDIYSPVSGEIVEVTKVSLDGLHADPLGEGWLFRIHVKDVKELDSLMDWEEYQEQCKKSPEH